MFFDERAIETSELTHRKLSEGAIARIRGELAAEGEEVCVGCDEPIPAERRAALPSAERCIGCQTTFERGRFGRPTAALHEAGRHGWPTAPLHEAGRHGWPTAPLREAGR